MHVLTSFLGRTERKENGYRTTRYHFNNELHEPTAFVGYLLNRQVAPDKLVILGTCGSMWDHLLEKDVNLGSEAEEKRLALIDEVDKKSVTQS